MTASPTNSQRWVALLPRLARYLPANLFNRLRELPAELDQFDDRRAQRQIALKLVDATRSLDPLYRVLLDYTPHYLLELDPTPGQAYGELLEGTFVFADVTGFTALTELLSKQGHTRGREIMNQIMNRLFSSILEPLTASGGDLLIFAGDAVLAYFPRQEHANDVFQATRAALRMERAIVPFASFDTEYGPCSLTMSIGVERGLAYAGVVGSPHRMELLVSGPATAEATAAEGLGEPGQVIAGPKAQAVIRDRFTLTGPVVIDNLGEALGDYEISLPTRKVGGSAILGLTITEVLETLEASLQRVEQLAPFLAEDILARLVNAGRQRQLESEFRPVAVQFINVYGLEDLAVNQGPEIVTVAFQRYFVQAQEIVNRHEGVISQVDTYAKGFTLLNTYGAPRAHEGTKRYAVSAALQLARALEQVNREFNLDPPLQQRGGITHGLVFTGEIGATYRREAVTAGPAVNRAARLMSKAQFGQVILDADIWADTQAAFVGEQLPAIKLKGIEGPVVIVDVRKMRRGTRLLPLERPLVGRESEQKRLAEAVDALAAKSGGQAWMVSGETGVGKTSLMADLAAVAQGRGLKVLMGRCQPHGKYIPLFPWLDLVAGWLDLDENANPAEQRIRLAEALTRLDLPALEYALADLLGLPAVESSKKRQTGSSPRKEASLAATLSGRVQTRPAPGSSPATLEALLKSRLAPDDATAVRKPTERPTVWQQLAERVSGPRVIIKLLARLTEKQPLVVILEDAQWLDNESFILLNDLLRQIKQMACLLVLTGREPLAGANVSPLPLPPLAGDAVIQIAERALNGHIGDDALAQWICERAGGIPLYVEALGQALQESGAILCDRDTGEIRWSGQVPTLPLSLHEVLLARFEELPMAQQDVLKRAAVLGSSFTGEALLSLYQKGVNESEVLAALEETVKTAFVAGVGETGYRFTHPLMHETIYETLSYSQRQTWHTQAGDWLVNNKPETSLELIAYHYLRGSEVKKAAEYGCRAGDKARERGVYTGAIEYYDQVLKLSGVSPATQLRAAEGRADALALQGDYAAAVAAYSQAIELGSADALGKQAVLSGDLARLEQTEFEPPLRPWAAGARAWLLAQGGQTDAALQIAQTALPLAEKPAQEALESLVQTLSTGQALTEYKVWLRQFTNGVLGRALA
ncbi:MAG: AAA family ATPase [Anaerolineae bacterium]|nr:AAA family ATPase [Anaerolineae bacterium]